jgi:hypothetical protein
MSHALTALRRQIADVLAVEAAEATGLSTGIAALDRAIVGGGIPRGRLTEIVGAQGSGKTTLVRQVVEQAVAAGTLVAYVDASRTLAPRDWAHVADPAEPVAGGPDPWGIAAAGGRLWMVRPVQAARGAWCADVLLRSGAFGLVVVDGAPTLSRPVAVRLIQLAREADAALVAMGEGRGASELGGALRLRVEARRTLGPAGSDDGGREGGRWRVRDGRERRFVVTVEKGGTQRTVEVSCGIGLARRLCTYPEVPDRRGVAKRGGSAELAERAGRRAAPAAAAGDVGGGDAGRVEPQSRRARRCAEPEFGRQPSH